MTKHFKEKMHLSDLLWILFGTGVMAFSINCFFAPVGMVTGGIIGIAMILRHLTEGLIRGGMPLWATNIALNIPLILLSVKIRGWRFLQRTILATALLSGWMAIIPEIDVGMSDFFLIAVIGGAIMGVGLGMVFYGKATTGGTDTIAALIQYAFPHLSAAKIFLFVDGAVILLAVFIFGLRPSLYAVVVVVLSGRIADEMVAGFRNAYLVYIISGKHMEIGEVIMLELDRGITRVPGTGGYTQSERPVLFCAVSRKQAVLLKDIVYRIDPAAFLILTDANEIRGEGFLHYSKEEF